MLQLSKVQFSTQCLVITLVIEYGSGKVKWKTWLTLFYYFTVKIITTRHLKVFMAFLLAQEQSDNDVQKSFMVLSSFEKQRICPPKVFFHVAFVRTLLFVLVFVLFIFGFRQNLYATVCALEITLVEVRKSLCYKLPLKNVPFKVVAVKIISFQLYLPDLRETHLAKEINCRNI